MSYDSVWMSTINLDISRHWLIHTMFLSCSTQLKKVVQCVNPSEFSNHLFHCIVPKYLNVWVSDLDSYLPVPQCTRRSVVVDHAATVCCVSYLQSSHAVQLKHNFVKLELMVGESGKLAGLTNFFYTELSNPYLLSKPQPSYNWT